MIPMLTPPVPSRPDIPAGHANAWIQTFTGKAVWPLHPREEDLCLEDIAHSLSRLCRFNGHCQGFYSVAQHCVHMVEAMQVMDHPLPELRWALMHDAAEAYIADVARPLKKMIPAFGEAEARLLEVIARKFGLGWPMPECIKQWDLVMLQTERRDLMGTAPMPWKTDELAEPLKTQIYAWSHREAEKEFLAVFGDLFGALDTTPPP